MMVMSGFAVRVWVSVFDERIPAQRQDLLMNRAGMVHVFVSDVSVGVVVVDNFVSRVTMNSVLNSVHVSVTIAVMLSSVLYLIDLSGWVNQVTLDFMVDWLLIVVVSMLLHSVVRVAFGVIIAMLLIVLITMVAVMRVMMLFRHMLNSILAMMLMLMAVVVGVRMAHIFRVCMVVRALGYDVCLFRPGHSEVLGQVRLAFFVVVSIVLVPVSVLRSHMMVGWVLVVVRRVMVIQVALMVLVGPRVVALVELTHSLGVITTLVAPLVRFLALIVRLTLMRSLSLSMRS